MAIYGYARASTVDQDVAPLEARLRRDYVSSLAATCQTAEDGFRRDALAAGLPSDNAPLAQKA